MAVIEDQQFCLRWNNFQANFTSQFETLRDDEDFTDVTIACGGQRLQAHKVVLSACSPYFKELFKENPCSHPIIFMRDVEVQHIIALMEFMYAGEVNVAQANLSAFLKTAESLKIRGLTATSYENLDESYGNYSNDLKHKINPVHQSNGTSSQDSPEEFSPSSSSPPPKRQCNSELELPRLETMNSLSAVKNEVNGQLELENIVIKPKIELSEDEDREEDISNFLKGSYLTELPGGIEIIPQTSTLKNELPDLQSADSRKLHSLDPRPCEECGRTYSNLSNLRQHMKLIHYPTFVNCYICNKAFKTDLYLRRHMSGAHNNITLNRSFPDTKTVLSINRVKMEIN